MKVAFRVDGSRFIGMGHVVRCLALGSAFRRAGHEVVFYSRFEPGISLLQSKGFSVQFLAAGFPDGPGKEYEPSGENEILVSTLSGQEIDCLITDSYRVDAAYFAAVRSVVDFSVYVDDLNRFPIDADGVINGNIYADSLGYENWAGKPFLWLGCRYNLLREDFRNLTLPPVAEIASKVLLTGGGGDSGPILVFLAKSLLDSSLSASLQLHMVAPSCSTADSDLAFLHDRCQGKLHIHRGVSDMASLMLQCDLAISAGGTTLYELCAAGVPRIAYILADNQRSGVEEMERRNLVLNLGPVESFNPESVVSLATALLADFPRRQEMRQLGRDLVDGQGADRTVAGIESMVATGRGKAI